MLYRSGRPENYLQQVLYFVRLERAFVQEIEAFCGGAEFSELVQVDAVHEPRVHGGYLRGFSAKVVKDIHVKFELLVNFVPVVDNRVIVGAETNDDPAGEIVERTEGGSDVAVCRGAVGCENEESFFPLRSELRSLGADLLNNLVDLRTERRAAGGSRALQ
ncbi:hypothetical protein TL16_g09886 [Triparma laevis f. inornata]|uniref:Uncharacterized protein n=1 Tax=Triparma laevis f. inornata TaxID=1714386 RepID=A0A9W7BAC2_9STRA|nr:hypothetical protein TL16_g09886 [Triparma laevis f. inornata]